MSVRPPVPGDDRGDAVELADLLATDALLDRIGGRRPDPADLEDPLSRMLASLAQGVDQGRQESRSGVGDLAVVHQPVVAGPVAAGQPTGTDGQRTTRSGRHRAARRPWVLRTRAEGTRVLSVHEPALRAAATVLLVAGIGVGIAVAAGVDPFGALRPDRGTTGQQVSVEAVADMIAEADRAVTGGDSQRASFLLGSVNRDLAQLDAHDAADLRRQVALVARKIDVALATATDTADATATATDGPAATADASPTGSPTDEPPTAPVTPPTGTGTGTPTTTDAGSPTGSPTSSATASPTLTGDTTPGSAGP